MAWWLARVVRKGKDPGYYQVRRFTEQLKGRTCLPRLFIVVVFHLLLRSTGTFSAFFFSFFLDPLGDLGKKAFAQCTFLFVYRFWSICTTHI